MKLPRQIKIGPHQWRVKRMVSPVPEGSAYDGTEHGCCEFDHQIIWIAPRVARRGGTLLAETLMHEVQHAINQHVGVTDGATEEHFTTQSAAGWVQVWADNPAFWAYIGDLVHSASISPRASLHTEAPNETESPLNRLTDTPQQLIEL